MFLAFLLSRGAVAPYQRYDHHYLYDGELASCIEPWELLTGKPIEGGDTSLLPILAFGASHLLFGFGLPSAQLPPILFGSASMVFFFLAFARMIGSWGALVSIAFLLVGFPHVWHAILPTVISSGLWTVGPLLYLLTFPPTPARIGLLVLLTALIPFSYPGAVLTLPALLATRFALLRDDWKWSQMPWIGAALALGGALAVLVRRSVQPESATFQLGLDRIALPDLDTFVPSGLAILRDLFVRGDSWYALTGSEAFVSWPLATLVAGSALLPCVSLARKARLQRSERWTLVLLLTFGLTLLLASANPRYPGVRRIYPATVLLIGSVGLLVERARGAPRWTRAVVSAWVAGALVYEGANTVQQARSFWDLDSRSTPRPLVLATADLLLQKERVAAVVFYPTIDARIDGVLCNLYFDRDLHRRFGRAYVVRSEDGRPVVLEDGRQRIEKIPEAAAGARLPLLADQEVPKALLEALGPPDAFEVHLVRR